MSNLKLKFQPRSFGEAFATLAGRKELQIGDNTRLVQDGDEIYATYHGNRIVRYGQHEVAVSFAGWATVTTANRINKLSRAAAQIRKGEPVINGQTLSDWEAWVSEQA